MSEFIVNETGYPGAIKQEIVDELVRCRECKDWYPFADKQFGYCRRQCWDDEGQYRLKVETAHDDYCSYGARKDG